MNFLRHKLQHYQDAKRLRAYLEQHAQLKARQAQEAATLALRLKLQGANIERQCRSLEKVDKREIAGFMHDQQCTQRIRARGQDGAMPSLVQILPGRRRAPGRGEVPDVMAAFEEARHAPRSPFPDVMAEFERATAVFRKERKEQREGEGPEKSRPLMPSRHRKSNEPDRER